MLEIIKEIGENLLEAKQLCDVGLGEVEMVSPIKIRIGEKLLLEESSLVFSKTVLGLKTDERLGEIDTTHAHPSASFDSKTKHKHKIEKLSEETNEVQISTSHSHGKSGDIYDLEHEHVIKGLEVGDLVILIRANGGQKYFVIDKVGDISDTY